jgi:hypothetical protein
MDLILIDKRNYSEALLEEIRKPNPKPSTTRNERTVKFHLKLFCNSEKFCCSSS